jgi:intein-encoded DNA endonuclease-like protein
MPNNSKSNRWSDDDIKSLKEDYIKPFDKKGMIKKYNRTWTAICLKAFSMGYGVNKQKEYNLKISHEEIIQEYNNKKSIVNIAKDYNSSVRYISLILKQNGIKQRTYEENNRKYSIDESFFEKIDTEEKAYLLGLLYADGYNNEKEGNVILTLQDKDVDLLNKISIVMNNENNLRFISKEKQRKEGKNDRDCYQYSMYSKKISKDLANLGCIQSKTFKIEFPNDNQLPKHLTNHFIRGYFDGDGSIYSAKRKNNWKDNYGFNIIGTLSLLADIQKILVNELGLNFTKMNTIKNKDAAYNIKYITYGGLNNCIKIKNYLYKDATIYMDRKFDKFNNIIN